MGARHRSRRRFDQNFLIFWAGQTCSVLGDAFALIAIPLLVLNATGSLAKMGLVTAAFGAGSLVAGVLAGPIVDRVDRRKLMIRCDLGRAAVYGLIPAVWWLVGPQIWLIYAVTVVGAGLGMIFGVAYITAVANLVDRSQITEANGRLQATYAAAFALGPVLAGLISGRFGPTAAIGVDATTFLASAASLSAVRLRRAVAVRPVGEPAGRKQEFLAGIRFLIEDPIFRWITFLLGALAFLATGATDLFIYYLRTGLGQDDQAVGIVFGIASIGAMLAGLFASRLRRRWGFGMLFIGGLLLQGTSLAAAGLAPTVAFVALITVVYTFAESIRGVVTMSLRQELTLIFCWATSPPHLTRSWRTGLKRAGRHHGRSVRSASVSRPLAGQAEVARRLTGRIRYDTGRKARFSAGTSPLRRRWHPSCNQRRGGTGHSALQPVVHGSATW